jgi:hypothetical protein
VRWIAALAAGCLTGCASIAAPPGGPARTTPPVLLAVTPDSGAVNVRAKSVMFTFDAVLADKAAGGDLSNVFLLSPQDGRPRVRWRRERIEVRPRRGFRPNTAYSVTLLPGIADLRGNQLKTGRTIVFSTGPAIPPYTVFGRVFDWVEQRVVPRALVEVIRRPDSLLYVGVADSTGQFGVGPVNQGSYTVRAIVDANNNRGLDPGEAWDSVAITVGGGASPFLELLVAPRDTVGPRLLTVVAQDTLALVATFDKPVNPDAPLTAASFRVVRADSTPLRVAAVRSRAQMDSARQALTDSAAARDTSRAGRDTLAPRRQPPSQPTRGREVVVPAPKPSRPAPIKELTVVLDSLTPMQPGMTYRVIAIDVRGLLGRPRTSERVITLSPLRARADSARVPPTGARPP